MSIKALVESSTTQEDKPTADEILLYCGTTQISHEFFFNQFSLEVARGFHEQRYTYEDCDAVMNHLFNIMTTAPFFDTEINIPEPAFSIFLTFDSGEYHHPHDLPHENPIEKHTRPGVSEILKLHTYRE
ncbi:hypothetical protein UNDKW_3575 [Undibacterium sp. KW1]|uniref:hypothetical protein n=1 Tax=Undibacterium sp. KW1 TaxID=2058624 RepID=UPI001331E941|nr:hypothetical protein [Undibacterium sp. KW1]BBB61848.1 hypothetical protein UNDKW_3575 [Undibacterium sp. KW1]